MQEYGKLRVHDRAEVFAAYITYRRAFTTTTGNFRGEETTVPTIGALPSPHDVTLARSSVDYVIYSYATPIAWHTVAGAWWVPDVNYSLTTGIHQGTVCAALKYGGVPYKTGESVNLRTGKGHSGVFGPRSWS